MNNYKYLLVEEFVLDYIKLNMLSKGDRIPSEREIVHQLNVSRTTVKYAIDQLIRKKVLYKVHGKGTFVNNSTFSTKILINKDSPNAFNLNIKSLGLEPSNRVLSFKVLYNYTLPNEKTYIKTREFYELIRLRMINREVVNYERTLFPFRLFSDANRYDFSKDSLYRYMENKGHIPTHFNKTIEVVHNPTMNQLLNIQPNLPLFLERYTTQDQKNNIIEYTESYTNIDNVQYDFNHSW